MGKGGEGERKEGAHEGEGGGTHMGKGRERKSKGPTVPACESKRREKSVCGEPTACMPAWWRCDAAQQVWGEVKPVNKKNLQQAQEL